MNNDIKIVGASFEEKIKIFEEISGEMEKLFSDIEREINNLVPYWNTKTSEIQYEEFKNFFSQTNAINNLNKTYINFLKNTVLISHEELQTKITQAVNESLDID